MINYKVLEALELVDKLIKEELKQTTLSYFERDYTIKARDKVQEAITFILKG